MLIINLQERKPGFQVAVEVLLLPKLFHQGSPKPIQADRSAVLLAKLQFLREHIAEGKDGRLLRLLSAVEGWPGERFKCRPKGC